MKIKALQNNVVVRIEAKPKKVESIEIPDGARVDNNEYMTAIVVDVGPGKEDTFMSIVSDVKSRVLSEAPKIKVGDRVIVSRYAADQRIKDSEGNELSVVDWTQVMAKIEE